MEKELREMVETWEHEFYETNVYKAGVFTKVEKVHRTNCQRCQVEKLLHSQSNETPITGALLRECCDMGEAEPVNIAAFWDEAAKKLREAIGKMDEPK